jgi:hypothetical protein
MAPALRHYSRYDHYLPGNGLFVEPWIPKARYAVTAIDILLDPDATMVKHAEAANQRLLKDFPKGSSWIARITRTSRVSSGS